MTEALVQDVVQIAGQLPLVLVALAIVGWAALAARAPAPARVLAATSASAFALVTLVPWVLVMVVGAVDAMRAFSESGAWTVMIVISNLIRALSVLGAGAAIAWSRP